MLTHGSPEPAHKLSVQSLAARVEALLGETVIMVALGEPMPGGARVLPLFLTRGRHLVADVPQLVSDCGGRLLAAPADCPDAVARIAVELAAEAGEGRPVLFALYRPSECGLEEALKHRGRRFPAQAIAYLHGIENMRAALARWRRQGIGKAVVQPLLIFPGDSLGRMRRLAADSNMAIRFGKTLHEHAGFPAFLARIFREGNRALLH